MNLSYFISKRINKPQSGSFSSIIHKIAIASVGIGLAIMIVSFLILGGFQKTIIEKNFSFSGHLNITKFSLASNYDEQPISKNSDFYKNHEKYTFIEHIQEVGLKRGLIKTEEGVAGAILKGIGPNYDSTRFKKIIIEGEFIKPLDSGYTTDVLISARMANKMRLSLGDDLIMYFIQKPPRPRKLVIKGIYESGLEEFDELFIIGDLGMIQRLNNWDKDKVGGFEVFIKDFDDLEFAQAAIDKDLDFDLYAQPVTEEFIEIFDWLTLINRQVFLFIGLILGVASFNMASILLILIMERTQMIGVLKALGAENLQIRKLFIYNGIWIILKGVLIGNAIGLGFGILQDRFHIIPLDYEHYFMEYVPIEWNWPAVVFVNILVIVIVSIVLIVPTTFISKIQPIKSIRFD